MKLRLALAALGFAALSAVAWAQAEQPAAKFDDAQKKAIQDIVREYLVANPEILLEMNQAFERKQELARAEAVTKRLPEFYKALAEMKDELAPFTVGSGDVTLIEFFDYNCGYCRRALPDITALMEKDKDIRTVFIEYPVLSQGSLDAARVGVAAARQGKYFEFHTALMQAGRADEAAALRIAEKIGLDIAKLKADMEAPETAQFLAKMAQLGRGLFIDGTPSFIIGDEIYPGAAEAEQLQKMVSKVRTSGCQACVKDDKKS